MTDKSWQVAEGPIQQADLLMGEFNDARKEEPSWETAILASENGPAKAMFYEFQNSPDGKAKVEGRQVDLGFVRPPKRKPFPACQSVASRKSNHSPSPRLQPTFTSSISARISPVSSASKSKVSPAQWRLRYGEMLHPDGRLMTENLRKARATDFYVLRGDPKGETYTPRFTFHGFQYVELTDFPGKPDLDTITGIVMHSDTPFTSDFECSDPMVNQLFKNVVWTQRANFLDLPTDCPTSDERFGWTGDAQVYIRTATCNADVAAFYQMAPGTDGVPTPSSTSPDMPHFRSSTGSTLAAWCDAGVICPWTIWKAYGDTRILERCLN